MNPLPVTNFIWSDGRLVARMPAAGDSDRRDLRGLSGQFAWHDVSPDGEHVFVRDRLGVNKLFLGQGPDRTLLWSNYWIDLVRRGVPAAGVWSVPAGHVLRMAPACESLTCAPWTALSFNDGRVETGEPSPARIGRRLAETFAQVREVSAGRPLYVALSGGLDSTVVAVLAREWLGPFTAVTFAVSDDASSEGAQDDLAFARRVAQELGVAHQIVTATPAELIGLLDPVLQYGQDWREFNVHCGIVNAALGRAIGAAHASGPRPLLLTGDVMNELMADYTPVMYRGREYYSLPRISPGRLRRYLAQGLDAGDREVGIFAHYGVDAIQPYALCADAYAQVPNRLIEQPQAKSALVRRVMGSRVPACIYDRPKVRAQVGSGAEVRGTLALFADHGLDAAHLQARFAALFGLEAADLPRMIRGGVFRCPSSYQALETPVLDFSTNGALQARP